MLVREYGGERRTFRLALGQVHDLERACGRVGIGEIYLRMAKQQFFAKDVFETVRLGLVGGGMPEADARDMVAERFDILPLSVHVSLALDILITLMAGEESGEDRKDTGDPAKPMDWDGILLQLVKLGLSPTQIREMEFKDFLALMRAAGRSDADLAPTEEEFEAMMARFEERNGNRD